MLVPLLESNGWSVWWDRTLKATRVGNASAYLEGVHYERSSTNVVS